MSSICKGADATAILLDQLNKSNYFSHASNCLSCSLAIGIFSRYDSLKVFMKHLENKMNSNFAARS